MTDKMSSFLKGLAMGLAGKPLEFALGKEPVAYLYNGVRLPKLPETDLPYAYISTGKVTTLLICALPCKIVQFDLDGTQWQSIGYTTEDCAYVTYRISTDDGNWYIETEGDCFAELPILQGTNTWIWANYDLLSKEDGKVYLAETEPVPVYE